MARTPNQTVTITADDLRELVASAVREALGAAAPPVPTPADPLPVGATSAVADEDELDRRRHRGRVAAFLRLDGREWPHPGPSPLEPGCEVRADVLAEYAARLERLRNAA